ncbi:MAG: DUF4349 domain-containing protein [Geodermatophilaceae bacterium]|nr:DUF4349 domain-containing protein [Geodermatophilaceae bacterium]
MAVGLALTGCSGGGDSQTTAGGDGGGEAAIGGEDNSGGGGGDEGIGNQLPFGPAALEREVITTAEITVRSSDVSRDAERASQLVTTAGGQISGDVRGGVAERQTADLVLRVPPADVDDVLAGLADLGEELSRSVRSEDVTTVVADVDSRVASLQASLDRLRGLIADASDITDLVTLERELAGRETELESLQAQQRALNDQVALATVTLHLLAEQAEEPGDEPAGFLSGLAGGWDAFVTVGVTLLTLLGAALPFLATAAVLAGVALFIRRRRTAAAISSAAQPAD